MFNPPDYIVPQKSYTQEELEAAVLKAALEEREACAKVCEDIENTFKNAAYWNHAAGAINCSAAIRARGEK